MAARDWDENDPPQWVDAVSDAQQRLDIAAIRAILESVTKRKNG